MLEWFLLCFYHRVADTPLSLNKSNGSELPNADVLSLFRQATCSASASIHFNTLKVRKIYGYSDSRKIVKTRIVHHHLLLLLSDSVQTAYRETGVSNRSNSFTKVIYTGAYMILGAQNLHTFSQSRQIQICNLTSVSFRCHFLVCSRAKHVKLVLCN